MAGDRELDALVNAAGMYYERYLDGHDDADFIQAVTTQSEAVARARTIGSPALADFLHNLVLLHRARFLQTGDRDSLADAACAAHEAYVLAPDDSSHLEGFNYLHHELTRLVDPSSQSDRDWLVGFYRRMQREGHGDRVEVWGSLTLVLRNVAAVSRDAEDLRSLAEACERTIALGRADSPGLATHHDYAASALAYLAALDRDADAARRAVAHWEWLAERGISDEQIHGGRTRGWVLPCRVLAYELSGADGDRDAAFKALSALMEGPFPVDLGGWAQDIVASLLATGNPDAKRMAAQFAAWCARHMEDTESGARYRELPAVLNAVACCLPAANPVPWSGWPEYGSPVVRRLTPGLAEAMAARFPFAGYGGVIAPTGKLYFEKDIPVLAAQWEQTTWRPLRGHAVTRFREAIVLPPGEGKAEPTLIPSRLHTVIVTIGATGSEDVQVTDIEGDVTSREPRQRYPVGSMECSAAPPNPAANIFLDFDPPLLWPEPEAVTVPAGKERTIVVRGVTEAHEVRWRLRLRWRCGLRRGVIDVPLHTTGETGWRDFYSDEEIIRAPGNTLGSRGSSGPRPTAGA